MKFPVPIVKNLSSEYAQRWLDYYVKPSDRNRRQEEGIWRRTQNIENAKDSGWNSFNDCRRRIVYYLHNFDLQENDQNLYDLVISSLYIYYSLLVPLKELDYIEQSIYISLLEGGWHQSTEDKNYWQKGDLQFFIQKYKEHPQDIVNGRKFPEHYHSMDVIIRTRKIGDIQPQLPWDVLAKGMRTKDNRENPQEHLDLSALREFSPFHVEVGCGPSIEAGIPALHHLHELYCVTDLDTGKFIFGGPKDNIIQRIISNPQSEIPPLGSLFSAAFLAEPTKAHRALYALKENGYLLDPILTNNFDGLTQRVGLREQFLRRYDEAIPDVIFRDIAKAVLVIGSHADRRRVLARARNKGLKVIYLDPEGYYSNGNFVPYLLEGPKNQDIICRKTATEGLTELCMLFGIEL